MQNAVYDTHRRVANLDKNLEGSVNKLNENTAELVARLDTTDQQIRALQSTVEENSAKLDGLEKKVESLANRLYRSFGLSQAPGAPALPGPSGVDRDKQEPTRVLPEPGRPRTEEPLAVAPLAPVTAAPAAPSTPPAAPAVPPAGSSPEADYQQGQKSYASENYAAALDQFGLFLQRYPNSENCPNAQFWKGKSLQNLDRFEEAISEFEKLRSTYPTSVRVPYAMLYEALCQVRLGQTVRAADLLQQVVKDFPMTPAADQAKSELKKLQK
jgi:tol-pal system protein YbgF